ncbi:MAG: RidA family protein [Rhodospirillaceae bacterium]|jgi:enamine deaminase RidA (YjgF/YER057c/UK114 family)|nr:RidA family protein [Rhodospirillaceae bacterium]
MAGRIDARLADLGIELPEAAAAVANYVPYVVSGNMVYVAGQITLLGGKPQHVGIVGEGLDVEEAQKAARLCALNLIAQVKAACDGDLDRVARVVKLTGFVASAPGFTQQPAVINGASDLMVEVFGDAGRHARAAVGVIGLPLGVSVEVDGVFEIS